MSPESRLPQLLVRIVHNSVSLIGGQFFYRLVNFFASILIARSLGTEGFGQFSFIFVYLSFFETFVQFGLNSILVRRLSQEPGEAASVLGNAILLRTGFILAALPIAFVLVHTLGYPLRVRQGVILGSFHLFLALRPIFETVFRVNLKMIYPMIWNAVRALVNLALVAVIAFWFPVLPWFILAYLVSGFLAMAGLGLHTARLVRFDFRPRPALLRELFRESAPLLVSAYLTILYYRIDVFMLSLMKGFAEVGFYSTATRIAETITLISGSIFASYFPLFSRAFRQAPQEFQRLAGQAFGGLLLIGLPIALGGTLISRDLIPFFFGVEYAPAGTTLVILCWHSLFCFVSGLLANILISAGRQTADMWISLSLVFVNVGLNAVLIPSWSFNGAALATALTEIAGMGVYFGYALKSRLPVSFPWGPLRLALKINLPFAVLLGWLHWGLDLHPLVFIFLGTALYAVLLFAFRTLSWSDVKTYASAVVAP